MSELDVINKTALPLTKNILIQELKTLGLKAGDLVICHVSMSKLGWVVGREVTVVDAILEVLGKEGTLIFPSQSGDNSDPSYWQNPPVSEEWIETIKQNMPAFDKKRTPTRSMGKVVDQVLMHPECLRSNHPQVSFCGIGKMADEILSHHELNYGLGIHSPLQKLYDYNAKVLLLGVGYENCTCLHLSESKLPFTKTQKQGSSILVDNKPTWVEFDEYIYDDEDFSLLGNDYEKNHHPSKHLIGNSLCRLIDFVELCDYGYEWFKENRVTLQFDE